MLLLGSKSEWISWGCTTLSCGDWFTSSTAPRVFTLWSSLYLGTSRSLFVTRQTWTAVFRQVWTANQGRGTKICTLSYLHQVLLMFYVIILDFFVMGLCWQH